MEEGRHDRVKLYTVRQHLSVVIFIQNCLRLSVSRHKGVHLGWVSAVKRSVCFGLMGESRAYTGMTHLTSIFKHSCTSTALDMLESREMSQDIMGCTLVGSML